MMRLIEKKSQQVLEFTGDFIIPLDFEAFSLIIGTYVFYKNKELTKLNLWGSSNWFGDNIYHINDTLNGIDTSY